MQRHLTLVQTSVAQLAPRIGDVAANREAGVAAIEAAAERGAGLVMLPELASSGYAFSDREEIRGCAESLGGETVTAWADAARRCELVVVAGLPEALAGGRVANSVVVLDRGELLASYRKLHLWDRERLLFEPGDEAPPAVETSAGRLGIGVCYDLMFPEVSRLLSSLGAEVLCFPTNSPVEETPATGPGQRPMEVVVAQATAYVNRAAVVICDRHGTERGVEWVGCSCIVGADGVPLAVADGPSECVLDAELDLRASRQRSWGELSDVDADRRPELYRDWLEGERRPQSGP